MQQAPAQEHTDYATFGMRVAAVLVDTVLVVVVLAIVFSVVLVSRGTIDLQDPASTQELSRELASSGIPINYLTYAGIFVYYVVFEALFGASIGKLLLGMRVVMRDGTRVTGLAVVLRNLVRIPELMLLYAPSAVCCLSSRRRERIGDYAARTVVVRRHRPPVTVVNGAPPQTPPYGAPGAPPAAAPPYNAPGAAPQPGPPAPPAPAGWTPPPTVDAALARFKTAALAARGAHLTYLRFSERELAAGAVEHTGGYSEGYVSAWFTLVDTVSELKAARADLDRAAAQAGADVREVASRQPDLVHLLAELGPYFAATGDDELHAAFLAVARAESASSAGAAADPSPS